MENYLFHCSSLPELMTNGRSKDDLLSETAKSAIRDAWIKETFGREKYISSPAMEKGMIVETDNFELMEKVTGEKLFKNQKQYSNEFITGTPDAINNEVLVDAKSSWNLWTFAAVNEEKAKKDYYWQLVGYAWLTNLSRVKLSYGLVNTPSHILEGELYRMSYKIDESEVEKYRNNFEFDDIDPKLRVKQYEWIVTDEEKEMVKNKVIEARFYMQGLSL